MAGESKPLEMRLDQVRENVPGLAHGDVHLVLNIRWARKSGTALCGKPVAGMRKQGTPFSGWASVLCAGCTEALEL